VTENKPTVSVTALKDHTHDGKAYKTGDTYTVDAAQVESLAAQGMAAPVAAAKAPTAKPSHPVTPMSTHDFPAPEK
jgi:hypothetical protein